MEGIYTVAYFREMLENLLQEKAQENSLDPSLSDCYADTLYKVEEKSDDELLQAKLYADLGMDSMDVVQLIVYIESTEHVSILDHAESALGTGVSLTVGKFLNILNKYQEPEEDEAS